MLAKFVGKSTVSKQGQITVPLEARKDLRITLEKPLYVYESGEAIIALKRLVSLEELADCLFSEEQLIKEDKEKWSMNIDRKLQEQDRALLESGELTKEDFA